MNFHGVAVTVKIQSLSAVKLADEVEKGRIVNFDVKARMEEKARRSGWVRVGFALNVSTKPNVVKFEVEGLASLEGQDEEIRKMLESDPETNVPAVFGRVYQHVFMSMYLLATLIQAPYPPANLLKSGQETPAVQMEEIQPEIKTAESQSGVNEAQMQEAEQPIQAEIAGLKEEPTTDVEMAAAEVKSPA
jgi:hypothetical protein